MENGFNSTIENNIMHDSTTGIGVINYNINNGSDAFVSDKDYKGLMTNTIIRNNLIYNMSSNGVLCKAVRGIQLLNNTIYNVKVSGGYWGAIGLAAYTNVPCPDWTIKNNIVSQSPQTVWYQGAAPETIATNFYDVFNVSVYNSGNKTFSQWQAMGFDVNGKIGNPLFVNAATGDFHLQTNSPACGTGAFPCGNAVSTVIPTSTPIATATKASTPTATPTSTQLPPTPTATVSLVSTATKTSAPTATPTATKLPPTPTATASLVPTITKTSVPTAASTATLQPASPTISPATPITASIGMKSVDIRVAQGKNDVEETASGKMIINSTNLELIWTDNAQTVGIRFTGVSIPQGATITNAFIQFKAGTTSTWSTTLSIQGDASTNAKAFSTTFKNVSSRSRTTKSVNWVASSWSTGAVGPAQSTPNLAPIIQEIISKPNWVSGNSMAIIITGSGNRAAKAYEGDAAGAPLLHIEYTANANMAASNISAPLAMSAVVSTELSTTLPATQVPVATATALPSTEVPVFTATALPATLVPVSTATSTVEAPSPIIPITSSSNGGQDSVLPIFTPTAESVNVINQQPMITSNGGISIAENTTVVATITATDADLPAQTLAYSISGGADATLFNINSSTGELTFVTAPNFENPADSGVDNIYNATVQVSDGTLTATQDVVVTVTAIDDNIPVITSNGSLSIAENTLAVTTVTATDVDLPAETLTYSISGGADAALFNINSSTGELTFIAAPDFELPADAGMDNIYNVTVQASDGTLVVTQDVVVTITEINDNTPVITSGGEFSIAENTAAVTTIIATDADLPAQTLAYSILGGADATLFSINSATGELNFITAPDFELPADVGMDNIYNVTVQASDGTLTAVQDVVVTITEINDNTPVITSNGNLSIAENTVAVTTVTATDADLPAQTLAYSISGGADATLFSINSATGELTFIAAPDFEIPADAGSDNVYNVTVQASDGTLITTQDIAIAVAAVDDNNPVITSNGNLSIAENTAVVTTVTATDADLPAQPLTYSISGGVDASLFNINSSTGELAFIAAPTFEIPADAGSDNIYNVTVKVSGETLTATQEIVVTIKGTDQPQ